MKTSSPALHEVAGAVGKESVLDPLVLPVPIVGGVDQREAEGPVGDGGLETGPPPGRGSSRRSASSALSPVQLDAVGLDGQAARPSQSLRQLRRGLPGPAAGVEDPQRLPVPVVVAARGVDQPRDQVDHTGRGGVKPPFCLGCESHVGAPFSWLSVDGPNRQGPGLQK